MANRRPDRYEKLFVLDVKDRLINNTPFDVYRLASQFPRDVVEVIDLRCLSRDIPLPASEESYLFLETAGTWMCFDWAPERFADSIARIQATGTRLTVVGPQARALRELLGGEFQVIDALDFSPQILPRAGEPSRVIGDTWLCQQRNRHYNGEYWDGVELRLQDTFSVCHSMSCPLACAFCFYGRTRHEPGSDLTQLLGDMRKIRSAGFHHFYFMDPNFAFGERRYRQWMVFQDETERRCTFCCQLSPNMLGQKTIDRLQAAGCRSIVVGVENQELIQFKGAIDTLTDSLTLVADRGMLPLLFVLIDGRNDVRRLGEQVFRYPFRYGVLNQAYASDRSLPAIQRGFSEKERLRAQSHDLIDELRALPSFLENAVAHQQGA